MSDRISLLEEDRGLLDNLRKTLSGMQEEAESIERIHDTISDELVLLERKINDTLEIVEEAEKMADRVEVSAQHRDDKERLKDEDRSYASGITEEDVQRKDQKVKNEIHAVAEKVREAEENTNEIREIAEDAHEKVEEELRDIAKIGKADSKVAEIEGRLEDINENLPEWSK